MIARFTILILINFLLFGLSGIGQDSALSMNNAQKVKYFSAVSTKTKKMSNSINSYTGKVVKKMAGRERKLKKLVMKFNPSLGKKLFGYSTDSLSALKSRVQNGLDKNRPGIKNYFPYLDTLKQSVSFINTAGKAPEGSLTDSLKGLEGKIAAAEKLQEFIIERQKILQENLKGIPGVSKHLQSINKDVYYFSEQMSEYRSVFSEPGKIEKLVSASLLKVPAFQEFMKQNSALAGLFPFNGAPASGSGNIPIVNGIPSRAAIQENMQQNMPVNTANVSRLTQQEVPAPQSMVDKLKNKVRKDGKEDNDASQVTTNSQRSKSFWKRIEYGTDVQFAKSSTYFPSTTDIAVKVGYKLNDKSTVGVGTTYKLGLGTGWNKIQFTHQGFGFRSLIDWKMKGSFYVQGGYELNYNNSFKTVEELKDRSAWQPSMLFGVVKKFQLSKKVKGNVQMMYDFLHRRNIPNTQPLIFRFGYGLK